MLALRGHQLPQVRRLDLRPLPPPLRLGQALPQRHRVLPGRGSRRVGPGRGVHPQPGRQEVRHGDQPAPNGVLVRAGEGAVRSASADRGGGDAARGGGFPLGQLGPGHARIIPGRALHTVHIHPTRLSAEFLGFAFGR